MSYNPSYVGDFALAGTVIAFLIVIGVLDSSVTWWVPLVSVVAVGAALTVTYWILYGLFELIRAAFDNNRS